MITGWLAIGDVHVNDDFRKMCVGGVIKVIFEWLVSSASSAECDTIRELHLD
jgi:hypothetical protein